jgi:hypothetical protein
MPNACRSRGGWGLVIGHLLVIGICGLGICCIAGCNVIGAAAYVIGPPAVEPLYVPDPTPMLVLAENYNSPAAPSLNAEQLERFVMDELQKHDIAPMADYEKVYELRSADPETFRSMSIAALGRLANAAQVLYIDTQADSAEVAPGSGMLKGQAFARVRIVDAQNGRTLWPDDGSPGHAVQYETKFTQASGPGDRAALDRAIQQALADRIVKLFHKYSPDEFDK